MFVRERNAPDILLPFCSSLCVHTQTEKRQTDYDDDDENQQLVAIESEWMSCRVSSSWSHKWKFFTSPYISTHSRDDYFWFSHSATWYATTYWSVCGVRCCCCYSSFKQRIFILFVFFSVTFWTEKRAKNKKKNENSYGNFRTFQSKRVRARVCVCQKSCRSVCALTIYRAHWNINYDWLIDNISWKKDRTAKSYLPVNQLELVFWCVARIHRI